MENKNSPGKTRLEKAIGIFEMHHYDTMEQTQGAIDYSPRYQQKMRKLLRKNTGSFSACRKRTLAILIAASLLGAGMIGISAAKPPAALEWIGNIYETFTELFFSARDISRAPDTIETVFMPSFIPEGYFTEDRYFSQSSVTALWKNADEDNIFLAQTILNSKTTVDHENAESELRELGNLKILILRKKEQRCYYWTSDGYFYALLVSDTLSDDICTKIILSMQKEA